MRKIVLFSVIQQLLYYISSIESLIGRNITPIRGGEFPYIASFQYFPGGQNFCGGALITKKHVITSTSCVKDLSPRIFRIVFEVAHAEEPTVAYTAASVTTYFDWAGSQNIPRYDEHGLAIVTLTCRVYNVNPVPLNGMTKRQLDGKAAIMIGWKNDVLSKANVNFLSDEDGNRNLRVLRNNITVLFNDRDLRTSADPFALLDIQDLGSPLLHARDKSLVGIAFACIPDDEYVRGNFSTEFIRQHQVNLYFSVQYYRSFIYSIIPAAPGA